MASYFKRVANVSKNLRIAEISGMIQPKSTKTKVEIRPSINHVICIDISGSMYEVLPKIRTQLKSRLVDIVGDNDTVSLVWFDDKCGFVSKMVQISKANDVRELNKKIDEMLKCGGCTNFLDPVKLTNTLIDRMKSSKGLWDFFFMSDGGHNTGGSWTEVINELTNLQGKISNATICEYGYWADSKRLTEMAEVLGGQKIFDKDFDEYQVDFEKVIKTGSTETVERVKFDIEDFKPSMKLQLMFTVNKDLKSINVYNTDRLDSILIPENTEKIYYIEKSKSECVPNSDDIEIDNSAVYAAVYLLAERLKYDLAEEILYGTKDKELIETYCNSFGKQKLEAFKSIVLSRVYGETTCTDYVKDNKYRPNPKKYCMLDFVDDLMSDESSLVHLTHPDFNYVLTTAKSVKKIELTEDDRLKLSKSSTKLKADKVLKDAAKYQVEQSYSDVNAGYSVNSLTWNNERANLSIMVRIPVELSVPKKENPSERMTVKSFITRNYTIIKDGILNVTEIPVTLNSTLKGKFKRMGMVKKDYGKNMVLLDISSLPIINKKRTETVYALDLSSKELELLKFRAINKYLGYLKKSVESTGVNISRDDEETTYLKSLGITEKGYTPKSELDKSGDFYMASCLETKIEKFSNLPKIEDVLKKVSNNKSFTLSENYMYTYMKYIDSILDSSTDYESTLSDLIEINKGNQRKVMSEISKSKFVILVSRKWFADKSDYDDNSIDVNIESNKLKMMFVFTEKKIDL